MLKSFNASRELFICLLLIVITLAVFWPVKDHEFINYDDDLYVTENSQVQTGFTVEGLKWVFTSTHTGNWHPLTWFSHMLDVRLFGLKPGWHHIVNLFFHIANTLLLFFVLHRMTKALWQCAFVAALFALHPLHVESVAWVAERKDVLSTFFWIHTMGAYVYYVEHPEYQRYLPSLLFFVLGLLSKPMLVTLPFVLLLLDYWPLKRFQHQESVPGIQANSLKPASAVKKKSVKKHQPEKEKIQTKKSIDFRYQWTLIRPLLWEKLPFFVLTTLFSVVAYLAQQKAGAMVSFKVFPLSVRISNAVVSYVGYIEKMIWPVNLAVFYPHSGMLPLWKIFTAVLVLAIITYSAIRMARRFPYVIIGWLWYLGTLVPVIGLVQVGGQAMADRYTYVSFIGLFIMIAWGVPVLLKKWYYKKAFLAMSTGIILFALIFITRAQLQHWQDSITLFQQTLKVTKNNDIAHNNLGHALNQKDNIQESIPHFIEAIRINPNYAEAHNNMGKALFMQGAIGEAIFHLREALRINPNYAEAYNNMGNALFMKGAIGEAIFHLREALRIKLDYADAHYNLGNILASQARIDEAATHFRDTIRIKPDYAKALIGLGNTLVMKGLLSDAMICYSRVVEIIPDNAEVHYDMGTILVSQGKIDEAMTHFREAIRIKPDFAKAYNNLGSALVLSGKIDEAIAYFREALRLMPDYHIARDNLKDALSKHKS